MKENQNHLGGVHQRLFWIDAARATAIVSITFNHAMSRSFSYFRGGEIEFTQMANSISFFRAVLWCFSRMGVPLFLMISGALLLDRKYEEKPELTRFIKHNWWELFRTTELWLVIMFCYLQCFTGSVMKSEGIFRAIVKLGQTVLFLNQATMPSMWYMSMILCVYLMIPVISVGLRKLTNKLFYVIYAIAVMSGMIIPNMNTILSTLGIEKSIRFALSVTDLFSSYFLYILAGYWVSHRKLEQINKIWVYSGFVVSFLGTSLFQYWMYAASSGYHVRYADIGVLVSTTLLFEIIRREAKRVRGGKKTITNLSKISFGIYMLHICIMYGVNFAIKDDILMFPKFLVLEISSFMSSIVIIWLTSKNKNIGRYLYLIKE